MSALFDNVADKFAGDIDHAVKAGHYVRGDYFVQLAREWIPPGAYVLDYGCGPGRLSRLLQQCGLRLFGVDTSAGMIEQARTQAAKDGSIEFKVIERSADAMAPQAYDAVVCSSVIEYVPDANALLQQFRDSLRGPRMLIISFANSRSYFRKRWEAEAVANPMGPGQHHTWDHASFEALLARNGFRLVTSPLYFESPWDWRPWGRWFKRVPQVGSLGVVVAQSIDATPLA
jgi:2-polyprenyl-3-methyl-5-hydroxy-6-metoxy-1,4-benzoquinol methylase